VSCSASRAPTVLRRFRPVGSLLLRQEFWWRRLFFRFIADLAFTPLLQRIRRKITRKVRLFLSGRQSVDRNLGDWLIYPEARTTDMLYLVARDSQLAGGSGRRRFIAGLRTAVIRRCVSPGSMKRWSAGVQIDLAALFA